jgi:murein DD-endopeptidase MepM/ murein hydrolase activator NlpD
VDEEPVQRLAFTFRYFILALAVATLLLGAFALSYGSKLRRAEASARELRTLTSTQQDRLRQFDRQTNALSSELRRLQQQNDVITRLFVGRGKAEAPPPRRKGKRTDVSASADAFAAVEARLAALARASSRMRREDERLRTLAFRVLNVRELQTIARARVLAGIPSLNPAGAGVAIRSPYGWRVDPWPEFHDGVDLDVDYGDPVRAAAAGTVVAAGYDGDYGIKIDIDHGNGYHTWYCHLSRADVQAGDYVAKGEHIALVGSTGESTGPHLHYQIMLAGHAVDPAPYLAGVPGRVLASLK